MGKTNEPAGGFIKIHRKIFDWEWWSEPNTFRLFITILLMANWTDKEWQGQTIPRGSVFTSIRALARKSGLTERQTRSALNRLKTTHELTIKTTSRGTLITVENYDVYQADTEKATQQTTHKRSNKRHTESKKTTHKTTTTKEHIRSINKEVKEIKQQQVGRTATDINELLTVEEVVELGRKYERIDALLSEVEADINAKEKTVRYPFRYVDGYARNKGWPRKGEN